MHEAQQVIDGLMSPREVVLERSTATGILSLDRCLGGSLPAGAVEIYGGASTGKTSLLYRVMAQAQLEEYQVALCPSEYLDLPYMKAVGVDLSTLPLMGATCAEHVFESSLEFLQLDRVVLAFDSVTALRPRRDEPGRWLALVAQYLEDVAGCLGRESCVILVNQVRMHRSVDPSRFFADQTDSTARKITHWFAARLELSRSAVSDDQFTMGVNIVANTLACPCRVQELPFTKGRGVDRELDYLRTWMSSKPGGWYEIDGQMIQGEAAAAARLRENPEDFENRVSICRKVINSAQGDCRL